MKKYFYKGILMAGILAAGILVSACGNPSAKKSAVAEAGSAEENPVIDNIMARRSIRKYKTQPVEDAKLQEILKCGINAPNGMYKQSWEIRVVRNPEFLAAIGRGFDEQRAKEGKKGRGSAFYGAPCLIFIANDENYDLSQIDCGLLGENMILAAQSMGLGTCCLGQVARFMRSEDAKDLLQRLELPEHYHLLYAISVGYPDEAPAAKPRDRGKVKFYD